MFCARVSSSVMQEKKVAQKEKKEKKPGGRSSSSGVVKDKQGLHLTMDMRIRFYEKGCARCRYVAGCTPSCWLKRDFAKMLYKKEGESL
jgi:hypothetical protein